ncbi:alpha/beta hydrolase family protein [Lentzea aerocolonigenes]|uniref:alpha/beta hydrolase family protein n=1 Tax=Lentzea aerocolonigenes TaxID=68170 RepID=UPI000696A963|nr:lipase family protein [Lentzea aerocolonigenes]
MDASRVRFGVDAKRIAYGTIDPTGRPTTASALIALPRNDDRAPRQAVWLHGTTGYRGSVASVADGNDRAAALLFASAGYLTTAPDYLGLGTGPGYHPYVDTPSTVTASVDALRAASQFAERKGLKPDQRLMITGHSQGGHATMAMGEALQHDRQFRVGALAPIGGPFKPSLLVGKALNDEISNGVAYMAYWTVAWNRLFHLYDNPAEVFKDPSVAALFDGDHRNEDIFPHLPATMHELLTDTYFERLRKPTGTLRARLREADSYCDWRPQVPVKIYSSTGDKDTLLDLGPDVNHGKAAKIALPRILADFDRA